MDAFAQTRGADDLFDDDFTPIAQPEADAQQPVSTPSQPAPAAAAPTHTNARGSGRGVRGSGRGRGRAGAVVNSVPHVPQRTEPQTTSGAEITATETDAAAAKQDKPSAVRGDRSGTGGVKKDRLTADQLAERMRTMSLKNAALQAAHERAQQDEAAFSAREEAAAVRRKEERQNRLQMNGERERNRQRKLQAVGGREWDAEKKEEEYAPDEKRGARRGAHGAVVGSISSRHTPDEGSADVSGPPRRGAHGDRERGRGRGRGRGGAGARGGRPDNDAQQHGQPRPTQSPPKASDFPDLPASTAPIDSSEVKAPAKLDFPIKPKDKNKPPETQDDGVPEGEKKSSLDKFKEANDKLGFSPLSIPGGEKKSWADQVESPS